MGMGADNQSPMTQAYKIVEIQKRGKMGVSRAY
jgi:hypothetical protein